MRFYCLVTWILCAISAPAFSHEKPLNIAFFPLSSTEGSTRYWQGVVDFARASASDLNINLKVIYNEGGHRRSYVESIESLLKGDNKPDAFMAASYLKSAPRVIELAERSGSVDHG